MPLLCIFKNIFQLVVCTYEFCHETRVVGKVHFLKCVEMILFVF